ncbi:MAG TPA: alpha-amylase family glycosyl hydrolase [Candidatus Limnocylindrales bacterium]|nr:alpha-amylase family glycosyl hydrolase [Candidatus Limnocylindrales bacterium]
MSQGASWRLFVRLALIVGLTFQACGAPQPVPTTDPAPPPTPSVPPTLTPPPAPTAPPTPSPTPPPRHGHDGVIDLAGLAHDSRDLLYRTPGGAVAAGTPVRIRLRTFWNDVTGVRLRLFSVNSGAEQMLEMQLAAENVDCYEDSPAVGDNTCDFWEARLDNGDADNIWYRFIVSDGGATAYYADDTSALDGGLGRGTSAGVDNSYALMVHEPGFEAPAWPGSAVAYQIFPDRFRNGDPTNDPQTGDVRYDDPVLLLPWDTLPEGYCRRYADAAEACPWRFDDDPPAWSPRIEGPRGRDYMGGDLRGVIERLDYLAELGVDTLYFNPLFAAGSNHRYDTRDYTVIDPYLGTEADFEELIRETDARGMRVILDGVFNHTSSDSPWFDRYGHYDEVGACESAESPWREWYYMTTSRGPCVGPNGPGTSNYQSWFGFDTLPILLKIRPPVQDYFLTAPDSITRRWLEAGAAGWRMDVSGDVSFPRDYWRIFREVVRETDPEALTISETWQKDVALLRNIRGDRFDTTMNYRLRDAVLGLLAPQPFDAKGFPDSGQPLAPSRFADRLLSIQEDYPAAAFFTLMNLLDSHDTQRVLWALTPGPATREGREFDQDNLAEGKQRVRLASLIQFSVPGMPQIYYGGEVGLTGDDDPDDRRTYPWPDLGGEPDMALFDHYRSLAELRRELSAMVDGDLSVPYADDASGSVALARRNEQQAVLVVINAGNTEQAITVPLDGLAPDGSAFRAVLAVNGTELVGATAVEGGLSVRLPALGALVLAADRLDRPAAPAGLRASDVGDGYIELSWPATSAARYNLYRSPLSGGGWVRITEQPLTEGSFRDEGLENGRLYHYVATALDDAGNESDFSNEASEAPRLSIHSVRLAGPVQVSHVVSAVEPTEPICAEVVLADPVEGAPPPGLSLELGFGRGGSPPDDEWSWTGASPTSVEGQTVRACAGLLPEVTGDYDYLFRLPPMHGREPLYADADGLFEAGLAPRSPGRLTVTPSPDDQPPGAPVELHIVSATPTTIQLAWRAPAGEAIGLYEVSRSDSRDPKSTALARTAEPVYLDTDVVEGETYTYRVVAVDTSWNRSPAAEASATAAARVVEVTFTVSVPIASGAAVGRDVHIAGTLSRLDGDLPDWNPGGVALEQVSDTTWSITLRGSEGTQLEYKYTLGDWEHVEKDSACGEIDNRRLVVSFESDEGQQVSDSVPSWRNVAPCGD